MNSRPLYYNMTLQDLRLIIGDFYVAMQACINPQGELTTFLDDGTYGSSLLKRIFDGEDLGIKGGWRVFFDCLNRCITPDHSGRHFIYQFKSKTIKGSFIHPMTPRGVDGYRWHSAGGGSPLYLSECGSVATWVYAREIGIIPVPYGSHALFMTYLYERRYGVDEFLSKNRVNIQTVQSELLKMEGIAYKSPLNANILACKGSINDSEEIVFLNNGYFIEYI